jgi:hypothetical protein
MDETSVCLAESQMTAISNINTETDERVCKFCVYFTRICHITHLWNCVFHNLRRLRVRLGQYWGLSTGAKCFQVHQVWQQLALEYALLENLLMIQEFPKQPR